MKPTLLLGISPCPNDTYIFHHLIHGLEERGYDLEVEYHDIETLNELACAGKFDIVKVSYALLDSLLDRYVLLRSGGALGYGVGPLLVSTQPRQLFAGARVLSPGARTTAQKLFSAYSTIDTSIEYRPFKTIMPALINGEADFGILIHESRFTYEQQKLHRIADLGTWWETTTGAPIPLGGIVMRRSLGHALAVTLQNDIRQSIITATRTMGETLAFCRQHAQELDDHVMLSHIQLYVNDFSFDIGEDGEKAIRHFLGQEHASNTTTTTDEIWVTQ